MPDAPVDVETAPCVNCGVASAYAYFSDLCLLCRLDPRRGTVCICAVNDGTRTCPVPKGSHIWGDNNPLNQ